MERTLWRRRRAVDSPRPAGRRWTGLRRGSVLARRVLRRRRRDSARTLETYPTPRPRRIRSAHAEHGPVSGDVPAGGGHVEQAEDTGLLPGPRTRGRQISFALVNLCTLGSLGLGVLAIMLAMRGDIQLAALCLIACVACDGLDGMLARRFGVSSPFGMQMDSLADMCAFGVAAPVVLYASLAGTVARPAAAVACALVAACAAIRLARFNVSPRGNSRYFAGVPTTAAAAVLALTVLMELPLPGALQLVGVALLAFAMVSSFPYATLAALVRLPAWLWLVPLGTALINPQLTFLTLVAAYLLSGPVMWLRQRRTLRLQQS